MRTTSFRPRIVNTRATFSSIERKQKHMADMTHYGSVGFENGNYTKLSGSDNWTVEMVGGLPLGQIRINFADAVAGVYGVVVSAEHHRNAPLITANYGEVNDKGFTVHLWESVTDRTVMNASFSFAVLPTR